MKRFWIGATLISMLMAAPAFAQSPYPDDDDDDSGGVLTTSDDDDDKGTAAGGATVPSELTVGIGGGVIFPAELLTFNTIVADFNLASGLQIEPFFTAGVNRGALLFDDGTNETEDATGATFIGLGARGKLPFKQMRYARFHIIGEGALSFNSAFTDPDGSDNNLTDVTTIIALGWGVGVEVWFLRWMSLAATAVNPLVTFSTNTQTQDTAGDPVVTTNRVFQVEGTFSPQVGLLVKVWFN